MQRKVRSRRLNTGMTAYTVTSCRADGSCAETPLRGMASIKSRGPPNSADRIAQQRSGKLFGALDNGVPPEPGITRADQIEHIGQLIGAEIEQERYHTQLLII